jgi:hypothetical protein
MLRRVALVRIDVSEEPGASFIRVTKIGELGTTQAETSNRRTLRRNTSVRRLLVVAYVVPSSPIIVTLMMWALNSSGTSGVTRSTRRNIPEDNILHSHRHENLKSYTTLALFLVHRFLSPWWWRSSVPPKRRFLQEPHTVTSYKTPLFIVTAVTIWNLTTFCLIGSKLGYL